MAGGIGMPCGSSTRHMNRSDDRQRTWACSTEVGTADHPAKRGGILIRETRRMPWQRGQSSTSRPKLTFSVESILIIWRWILRLFVFRARTVLELFGLVLRFRLRGHDVAFGVDVA